MPAVRWLPCCLLLLSAAPASAQVKLEWKFEPGDTFLTERLYHQKLAVEVKGKQTRQEKSNTWLTRITVKEKTSGGYVLDCKIEAVTYKTHGAAPPDPFDEKLAAKMKGAGFLATITVQGKVAKFDGYDAFVQKLAEKNESVEKVLRVVVSEEALRDGLEDTFGFLPPKPVKPGDKWKRESIDPAPPFGSFKVATEYSYDGATNDQHKISFTTKMTYRPPSADPELFRIVKGGLKADEGKGTFLFDGNQGRMIRGEKTTHFKGDLVLESMGQQTPLEFTSDNTLTLRVVADKK